MSLTPPPCSHSSFPVSSSFSKFNANNKKSTNENRCCLQARLTPLCPFPHTFPAPRLFHSSQFFKLCDMPFVRVPHSFSVKAVARRHPSIILQGRFRSYITVEICAIRPNAFSTQRQTNAWKYARYDTACAARSACIRCTRQTLRL